MSFRLRSVAKIAKFTQMDLVRNCSLKNMEPDTLVKI